LHKTSPLFQAIFASAWAPARCARFRPATCLVNTNLQKHIYTNHFKNCVTGALKGSSEKEKQQKMAEIIKLTHQVRK